MKVLKNGKDKAFYAHCLGCGSDLEYTNDDVTKEKGEFTTQYIVCPVCGEKLNANMETKEELDDWKLRAIGAFSYSCKCGTTV